MKNLIRASALALAVALAVPVAPAGAVDIDAFVRRDTFNDIKISPTGEYFAGSVPLADSTVLAIIRRSDRKVMGTFGLGRHNHIADFTWVNPERVLIGMAEKFGSLDQPLPTGELYAINVDGSKPENLVGYRVESLGPGTKIQPKKVEDVAATLVDDLPGDDRTVVISVTPFAADTFSRAERLDVYTGRRVRITGAPVRNASFHTDNAGVVRFARGAGSDRVSKLYYRTGDGAEWQLINDESQTARREWPLGFSSDNRVAYLQVEHDKGPDAVVAFDPASGQRTEVLRDAVGDPEHVIYRPNSGIPVGVAFAAGPWTTRFFDPASPEARLQRSLETAFSGARVTVTSHTADGRIALVRVASDTNPGDYYLYDTTTKKADFLLASREWLDPQALHPSSPVSYTARDGLRIHGYLTRPKGSTGRLPMVVLPHGGPFGIRDYWGFDDDAQVLASAGYAVLQVNFRGSGGYGRAFMQAGAREWGKAMQDDITDATKWAVAEGIADGGRVCLYGASYGAYASLMGVAREPGLYRCAAGYVGVYDLPAMHTDGDIRASGSGKTYLEEWLGPPAQVAAVSPSRLADRIKAPVFLAAGGEDQRAPIQHSRLMEQALRKAGVPVETLYYDSEGHGFYRPEHRREFYARLLAFLSRHIGGATAAAPTAATAAK